MSDRFTLASLFAPTSPEEFLRDHHGRAMVHRPGPSTRFADLLTHRDLNEILRGHRLGAPRLRLSRAGKMLPESAYVQQVETLRGPARRLRTDLLLAALQGGATLALDGVDEAHPPLRPIKRTLERELDAHAWVNTYVSWGTESGFPFHWDDHDTIVLQVIGRKRWRIHPPTRRWPLEDDVGRAPIPARPETELVLEPGDALYLPRGFWHEVRPMAEPCIHLTVGLLRPTGVDFLGWLAHRLKAADAMRADLPLAMDAAGRARHAALLRQAVVEALDGPALEAYERGLRAATGHDPTPTLQAVHEDDRAWAPDAEAMLLTRDAIVDERGGYAVLATIGRELRFPREAAPSLRLLAAGDRLRIGPLRAVVPPGAIAELVAAGLLAVS